jgi:hypothetical protein
VLSDDGRQQDAIAEYRRAPEFEPEFDLAQFGWGLALARQRRFTEAAARINLERNAT